MKTHDILLRQIANTLLVNAQHLSLQGLFDGQLGVALFFYRYARHSGQKFYTAYSDDVMDAVIGSLNANTPKNFCGGLVGVGWAIGWLMNNGFVEPDETIFEAIDATFDNLSAAEAAAAERQADTPLFSEGLYALARGKRAMIARCVDRSETLLGGPGESVPLGYVNSVLHLLIGAYAMGIEPSRCESLARETVTRIGSVPREKRGDDSDLFIFDRLIGRMAGLIPDAPRWLPPAERTEPDEETMIRSCWSETIYGFPPAAGITPRGMEDFTDRAMRDIEQTNLTFHGGLAGLGLSLIKTSEQT